MTHVRHRNKPARDTCPKCGRENVAYTVYPYDYLIEWYRGQKSFYRHKSPEGLDCEGDV